ncbi:MAG: hypothetical protein [Microviridae sp.]|nr:MAG: hypothetical protein [Microviridae sp.]
MKNIQKIKIQFRTSNNYQFTDQGYEPVSGISETIPDQSFTIREILDKFVTNIPEFMLKNSQYPDVEPDIDQDIDDITSMDNIEKLQYIKDKTENYNQLLKKQSKTKNKEKTPDTTQTIEPNDITPKKELKDEIETQ